MVRKRIDGYFLCFLICATLSLVSSITLPYMVTNKPPRHREYTNVTGNEKAILDAVTTMTASKGVVLYRVTTSNGATCILFKVDGIIEVSFKSFKGEGLADQYMLDDAIIKGNCKDEDTAFMEIKRGGYNMTWNFSKTPGGERWYVSQIKLMVSTELKPFYSIRADVLPEKSFKLYHKQILFSTPVGKSYTCEESIIDLKHPEDEYNPARLSGRLLMRTLQLQPFIYKGSNFGPAFNCNANSL